MTELLNMVHSMKKLYDHLCLEVMGKYQMTRSELDILLFLHNNPSLNSAKDIVEKRGLTKSHASLGIEKLVKNGYLKTVIDEHDKRRVHLYLQPTVQPIIQDGLNIQRHFGDILFKGFSLNEMEIYQKLLKQIYENIKEEEAKS